MSKKISSHNTQVTNSIGDARKLFCSRAFWLVLIVALVARVAWAVAVPVVPVSDAEAYDVLARMIVSDGTFGLEPDKPTGYWGVGTPAVYAACYAVFAHRFVPIIVLHIVAGLAAIYLTMILASEWFDRRTALTAGWLLALWPSQIQFTTILASEPIFIFLMLLVLWLWTRREWNLWLRAIAVGLVVAAATYMRPPGLLLPIVLTISDAMRGRCIRQTAAVLVVSMLVMIAAIEPWARRNRELFGTPFGITANSGTNFWQGNNPDSIGEYMETPARFNGVNEGEVDRTLQREALDYVRAEPTKFVTRTARKLLKFHRAETIGVGWNETGITTRIGGWAIFPLKVLSAGYWFAMLGLALAGVVIVMQREGLFAGLAHPTVILWAYFALLHAVIVVQDRYHLPIVPLVAMLAALAGGMLVDRCLVKCREKYETIR